MSQRDNIDPLLHQLSTLHMPPPSAMAQADIVRAARQMPPRRHGLNARLHWLQAFLAIPQTRLVVMAALLACVIGLGLAGQSQRDVPVIPADLLLYDIAVSEFDEAQEGDWLIGDFI